MSELSKSKSKQAKRTDSQKWQKISLPKSISEPLSKVKTVLKTKSDEKAKTEIEGNKPKSKSNSKRSIVDRKIELVERELEGLKSKHINDTNIEPLSSEISLGFDEEQSDLDDHPSNQYLMRDGPDLYRTILKNICAYAIRCPHNRIVVQKLRKHFGYWLPYVYTDENERYTKTIEMIQQRFRDDLKSDVNVSETDHKTSISNVLSENFLKNVQLYSIYRFQLPDGLFISRYIFLADWSGLDSEVVCCKQTANFHWIKLKTILAESKPYGSPPSSLSKSIVQKFWGNEIEQCSHLLNQLKPGESVQYQSPKIFELNSDDIMKYFHRKISSKLDKSKTVVDQLSLLMIESKFTENDVVKIYSDFVQHCFPAMHMPFCSFLEYFKLMDFFHKHSDTEQDDLLTTDEIFKDETYNEFLWNLFRSFSLRKKPSLSFNEFLLGLAALDPKTPTVQLRCTYIFRCFDRDSDGFLNRNEFDRFKSDLQKKLALDSVLNDDQRKESNLSTQTKSMASKTDEIDPNKQEIGYVQFIKDALANRFQGLELLLRSEKPIMKTIYAKHLYQNILNKTGRPFSTKLIGTCPKCRENRSYSLAYHAIKLNLQGRINESKALVDSNCGEIDTELQFKIRKNSTELQHSIEIVFSENSVANKVLALVREMIDLNRLPRNRKNEIANYVITNLTIDLISKLCKEVTEIFLIEPRVLKINTPCIVIGDLHGNINDLLTFERQLWPLAPTSNASNVLFLGDYVDRGDYSIEVVCYLFAMKILAPTKFFLLRGNHEIRSIQRNFTFARECILKYSYQNGQKVFEEFNKTFDHLPLVGIVEESIFCAHGGIPFSVNRIEELYKIPIPLSDPEIESKASWEILWSDPVTDEEYAQIRQFRNQTSDNGFTENLRRSTAYYFTEKALRNFLQTNRLSHVIRAHELQDEGYRFHHSGLLITIFSSSRYCNTNNKSAAVFISSKEDEGFIKIIALET
ncbi:Serine/threonine-protein phosphatase PP1 isozyme 3 [Sarcoptes scabiei]|uniref:Serine/threonine-protein phosphatase n=1 Tax=Sarcoptes scabiei TaxID=52283 RepID=A0A834R4L7_SARSC|nr:Serine/threonine-protein phosphatase PP1 isozyme 3 [Sarcoptes scabiei]